MLKYNWIKATSTLFAQQNPVLEADVVGFESDTKYFKFGDGTTAYNDLDYINKAKSAYDIAVENGFSGTEQEWIESLKGLDGTNGIDGKDGVNGSDGTDGKSAYELAVNNGYIGTETEWLASLKGVDGKDGANGTDGVNGTNGVDGKSAYDIAVDNGYTGSESEWLISLKGLDGMNGTDGTNGSDGVNGTNGTDGKSAYDIAVENGFSGTEQEWLASLKGADGKDGTGGSDTTFETGTTTSTTVGELEAGTDISGMSVSDVIALILGNTTTPIPADAFSYYWGEIGLIRAASPNLISQANWETYMKPNGSDGNMTYYQNVTAIEDEYLKTPTGNSGRWWIMLVPNSLTPIVSSLANYNWKQYDAFAGNYSLLSDTLTIYTGTVTLDNIEYYYSAVKPTVTDANIKFTKN